MKRLFYLMLVVLGTMAFVSCSDDDENNGGNDGNNSGGGNGSVTLVTEAEDISYQDFYISTFNEGDIVTIDWGDGVTKSYKAEKDEYGNNIYLDYTYTDNKSNHTITIRCDKGIEGISCYGTKVTSLNVNDCIELVELRCGGNMLTSLDVSKNTALEYLYCSDNSLTSLDVSKNTALTRLDCPGNQFTAAEMNKIYEALPTVEDGYLSCDELGNPSIAEQKGWRVSFE